MSFIRNQDQHKSGRNERQHADAGSPLPRTRPCSSSSIRTLTVGSGIAPDLLTPPKRRLGKALAGSGRNPYRRWGVSPRPENRNVVDQRPEGGKGHSRKRPGEAKGSQSKRGPAMPNPFQILRSRSRLRLADNLRSAVDGVLQALAGRELRHVASRNVDFSAGGRVAALRCCAMRNGEAAEPCEADVALVLEFSLDNVENRVDSGSRVRLRQSCLFGHCGHEFILVHVSTPF
ncbi:hypothetical protein RHECNPAF_8900100 [Rhizobium etli CNPAF512]|nr:hypothetical protein RHECNPAF_8900100 [Rhizobium etli CNPAF512]